MAVLATLVAHIAQIDLQGLQRAAADCWKISALKQFESGVHISVSGKAYQIGKTADLGWQLEVKGGLATC